MKDWIRISRWCFLVATAAMLAAGFALADSGETEFVRVSETGDGSPAALEVAVASFAGPNGEVVDLVSAVHVADARYFRELDRRLADYPVVLYELVGDPEALDMPRGGSTSMIGLLQGGMTDVLGLAYQLDEMDYSGDNMVHADFTAEEFAGDMQERGESLVGLMFRAWALGLAQQGTGDAAAQQAEIFKVLFSDNPRHAMKRAMASQLAGQVDLLAQLSGPDGSALIEGRNGRALERLEEQLDAGQRRIAIFYGAGHMPDFAERLARDFGMRHASTEWIEAWDLRDP
jgi:hypothetical protein